MKGWTRWLQQSAIKANCWQPGGGAAAAPRGGDDYQQSNKRARTDQGVDIDALKRVLAGHSGAKGFGKGSKGDIYKVSWEEPAPAPKQPMVLQDMYCCKVRNAFDEIAPGNEEEVHEEKNETNIWNQDFFRIEKHAICNSLSYTAAAKELHRKNSMHEWNVAIGRKKLSRTSTTKRSAARRRRQDSDEDASPKAKPLLQCIECNLSASLDNGSCSAPKPTSKAESVIGTVDHISTDFVDSLDASALNILHDQSKWELVKVTIDSGACDHVMPKEIGKRFEIFPTKESLAGRNFSAANNTAIKNYGAREISGVTDDWTPMVDLKFNVADVKRCLCVFDAFLLLCNLFVLFIAAFSQSFLHLLFGVREDGTEGDARRDSDEGDESGENRVDFVSFGCDYISCRKAWSEKQRRKGRPRGHHGGGGKAIKFRREIQFGRVLEHEIEEEASCTSTKRCKPIHKRALRVQGKTSI